MYITDKDLLEILNSRGVREDKKGRFFVFCSTETRRSGSYLISKQRLVKLDKNFIDKVRRY